MNYYLGLDIGIASVGWAISSDDSIIDFGVQAWAMPKADRKETFANKRRQYRSATRLKNRKRAQKKELKKILCEKVFYRSLPDNKSLGEWVKNLNDKQNIYDLKYDFLYKNKTNLTEKELAWILLSYINRRGQKPFALKQSIDEATGSNEDKKKYEQQVEHARRIEEKKVDPVKDIVNNFKNEFYLHINQKYNVKNLLYTRESFRNECSKILEKYRIKNEIREKILEIIFSQFSFEEGPDPLHGKDAEDRKKNRIKLYKKLTKRQDELMRKNNKTKEDFNKIKIFRELRIALHHYLPPREQRGKCTYYKEEDRAAEASIIGDCYKFCQEANSKKKIGKESEKKEFRNIINHFFNNPKKIHRAYATPCKFWAYLRGEEKGNKVGNRMRFFKTLPSTEGIDELSNEELIKKLEEFAYFDKKVGSIFSDYASLDKQYEKIKPYLNLDEIKNEHDYEEKLYKSFSTSDLSLKIMLEAIKSFITDGKLVGQFLYEKEENLYLIEEKELPKTLNETFKINKLLNSTNKNSTVFRALTNVRKLLIDIHKYYRMELAIPDNQRLFETINVEISGSFKHTKRERDNIESAQKARRKENQNIDEILEKSGMIRNANNRMLLRLYFEQGGEIKNGVETKKATCFLTPGKGNISFEDDIIHEKVENGHIIPRSFGINKIENRFIVLKKANKEQGNRLPLEYIKELNNKKLLREYMNKIKKAKGKKSALFALSNRLSDKFNKLVKELQEVTINDTRYIAKIIINWLATELIKRDYIINKGELIDRKKNKYKNTDDAYRKWWKEKMKEMRYFRINQVTGLITSMIRKTFLFPLPNSYSEHKGTAEGAWGFPNKEKIKELTEWDHAVDGIALSLIHSKPALFFYQGYSNALRVYFDQMHKITKERNLENRLAMKKHLEKEINEEIKKGIFIALENYHIYKSNYPLWFSIINENFNNILTEIRKFDFSKPNNLLIHKPKIIMPIDEKRINKIIDMIPVKLKWFKINEISYNILEQLIETTDVKAKEYIQELKEMFQILENYVEKKLQNDQFWSKVKEKKSTIEKRTYIFFRPLFHILNRDNAVNKKQSIEIVKSFLKAVIKYVYDENKKEIRRMDNVAEFFLNYKNTSVINKEEKKIIEDFIYTKKLSNIYLSFTKDIYVDDINLNPPKVIKYLYDGKIRSMRKLVSSENPLRLCYKKIKTGISDAEKKKISKYNKNSLEHVITKTKNKNAKEEFLLIKKRILKLRKNYNAKEHEELNSLLSKYQCMIDQNGSLWPLNEYIGFVFAKDGTRKPVSSFYFNEMIKQGKRVADASKGEELVLFGREVYLKNNQKLKNYPVVMKSMNSVEKKEVYIKLNGIIGKALRGKRWEHLIGLRMFSKGSKYWNAEDLRISKSSIRFNGNIT